MRTSRAYRNFILVAFCALGLGVVEAQDHTDLFTYEHFIEGNDTLKYRLLLPKEFDKTKKYPVVLFLHGAGERGNNNQSQLVHGSKLFASEHTRDSFPSIVIFPQCPKDDYWANVDIDRSTRPITLNFPENAPPTKSLSLAMHLLDEYLAKPFISKEQVYLAGLSMGGMGTFEMLERKPDTFAAAIAICGGDNPSAAESYANHTKLWIFHGAKDDVVDPMLSVKMTEKLLDLGARPNFTLYAEANHNSWDPAFSEPNLLSWLFSNTNQNNTNEVSKD